MFVHNNSKHGRRARRLDPSEGVWLSLKCLKVQRTIWDDTRLCTECLGEEETSVVSHLFTTLYLQCDVLLQTAQGTWTARETRVIWSLKRNRPSGLWVGRPAVSASPEGTGCECVWVCLFVGHSTSLIALLIKGSNHSNRPSQAESSTVPWVWTLSLVLLFSTTVKQQTRNQSNQTHSETNLVFLAAKQTKPHRTALMSSYHYWAIQGTKNTHLNPTTLKWSRQHVSGFYLQQEQKRVESKRIEVRCCNVIVSCQWWD